MSIHELQAALRALDEVTVADCTAADWFSRFDDARAAVIEATRRVAEGAPATPQAEPIGWVFQHDETGRMSFCENDGINTPEVFQRLNPRHILCGPAFTHAPPATPQAAGAARGYVDDDRKRVVSSLQEMRDRLGGFLVSAYGDRFDGDIDTMLDALNLLKAVKIGPAAPQAAQVPEAYTTGHCDQHRKPGGCTLHNLQCGYPDCDRRPLAAAQAQAAQVPEGYAELRLAADRLFFAAINIELMAEFRERFPRKHAHLREAIEGIRPLLRDAAAQSQGARHD